MDVEYGMERRTRPIIDCTSVLLRRALFEEHPEVMDFLKSTPDMLRLGIESLAGPNNQSNVTNPIAELFQSSLQARHHPESNDIGASS